MSLKDTQWVVNYNREWKESHGGHMPTPAQAKEAYYESHPEERPALDGVPTDSESPKPQEQEKPAVSTATAATTTTETPKVKRGEWVRAYFKENPDSSAKACKTAFEAAHPGLEIALPSIYVAKNTKPKTSGSTKRTVAAAQPVGTTMDQLRAAKTYLGENGDVGEAEATLRKAAEFLSLFGGDVEDAINALGELASLR